MNNIVDIIKNKDNFLVLTHVNPDGDAVGSSLGVYLLLKTMGKNADIVVKDAPTKFSYLDGYKDIKLDSNKKYDYAIIVDTATKDRINSAELLDQVKEIVVIDHHRSNTKYGNINLIKEYPACCQIIYEIIKELDIEIDKSIGEAICNGLVTDTGGFSHGDVLSSTYKTVYELSKIVNVPYIYKNTLGTVTKPEFELKKITINNLEFYKDDKIVYSFVTEEDIKKCSGTHYDTAPLVNIAREIEGVYVSIFGKLFEDGYRISLRSNNIDVNLVANLFGGGGHVLASGITVNNKSDYDSIIDKLIIEIGKSIDEWDNSCK